MGKSSQPVYGKLTNREKQVLKLKAAGRSNREIASELGISTGNVGNLVTSLYAKLQTSDAATAAARARKDGQI